MLNSHNNRVTSLFVFVLLFIFFSIDFFALCFFWQPVSFFLLGAFSRLLLTPEPLVLVTSIVLLGLHAALSSLESKSFMFFLLLAWFLGSLVKKTVYNTPLLQIAFSGFIVVFYMIIIGWKPLSSWHNLFLSLSYSISALFAADRITKIVRTNI